jgi:hypothetical protein
VELLEYLRQAERLLLEQARTDIVDYLATHPKAGVIMRGTGGIRKLRWARVGMGKSGGVRVTMDSAFESIKRGLQEAIAHASGIPEHGGYPSSSIARCQGHPQADRNDANRICSSF